jgi:starch synthase
MAKKQVQKIFLLTREYDGLAGAGGVKDFSRQLAEALVRTGRRVSVMLPFYGFIDPRKFSF